jgi:hypothetical protein
VQLEREFTILQYLIAQDGATDATTPQTTTNLK